MLLPVLLAPPLEEALCVGLMVKVTLGVMVREKVPLALAQAVRVGERLPVAQAVPVGVLSAGVGVAATLPLPLVLAHTLTVGVPEGV